MASALWLGVGWALWGLALVLVAEPGPESCAESERATVPAQEF
jgi:hypothetical protein